MLAAVVSEFGAPVLVTSEVADLVAGAGEAVIDVILDNVGGDVGEAAFAVIAAGGRFSAHGAPSGRFAAIDPATAERRGVALSGIREVQPSAADLKRQPEAAMAKGGGRPHPACDRRRPCR